MIINWLVYAALVTAILTGAGFLLEYVARALRLPTRWGWLSVLVLSTLFSTVTLMRKILMPVDASVQEILQGPIRLASAVPGTHNALSFAVVNAGHWRHYDAPLLLALGGLVAAGLVIVAMIFARMDGMTYALDHGTVAGVPVLLSRNIGPALLGIFRFRIVVPRWIAELPPTDVRTILAHEQEHALASDPTFMLFALFLTALQPWNPAVWIVLSRLRLAVETDCDARVLGPDGDARHYGHVLLRVYERSEPGWTVLTALAARASQLELRVRRLVQPAPHSFSPQTFGALGGALALCVLAYSVDVSVPGPRGVVPAREARVGSVKATGAYAGGAFHMLPVFHVTSVVPDTRRASISENTGPYVAVQRGGAIYVYGSAPRVKAAGAAARARRRP